MTCAKIIWDGKTLEIPTELGCPKAGQLASTNLDNLVELAGRTCYDSLGSGRGSEDYHKHIVEVNHGSVWEHANLTFQSGLMERRDYLTWCEYFLNRPGIFIAKRVNADGIIDMRLTCNLRAIREWYSYPTTSTWSDAFGEQLQFLAKKFAPLVLKDKWGLGTNSLFVVEPETDNEIWVSMFITNVSRGLSHELVRHGDWTAISQRSTRYVDEGDSPWIRHPLLNKFPKVIDVDHFRALENVARVCRAVYIDLVNKLQTEMINQGIDKFSARKQARGAARGFLGNALMTELVFSANLAQWKRMILARANSAADGEIRLVFNEIFDLLSARFPERFQGWKKEPCPDGMGDEITREAVSQ